MLVVVFGSGGCQTNFEMLLGLKSRSVAVQQPSSQVASTFFPVKRELFLTTGLILGSMPLCSDNFASTLL